MQHLLFLAQTQEPTPEEAAVVVAAILFIVMITLLITLGINILICILLYTSYSKVPEEHRTLAPGMIFLLLIPLFNLIWNFFVFMRIPESYKNAFDAQGRTDVGDCGRAIGMWFAICAATSVVPCVNYISVPAALVLLIIFLIKMFSLKGLLNSSPTTPPVV